MGKTRLYTNKEANLYDPKGIIRETYLLEGISTAECRGIFFDWLIGLDPEIDPAEAAKTLLQIIDADESHMMSKLLCEATVKINSNKRRLRSRR